MADTHRDFCRRHHRIIGHYLAIQAWHRGLDCIVLDRVALGRLLGLERFKSARIKWLLSDLKPWFRHSKPFYDTSASSSIHSLFLSRTPLTGIPTEAMITEERIDAMPEDGPRTA